MFHLHSLKELPPKRTCETINFTSEVDATISSQESQPPIQRQVDQSTASEAVEINITEPFQPADFNFPKKHSGKQYRAFQSNWFSEFPWLHYNKQSNSVLCFIFMQQNAKSNLRAARSKEVYFISKASPLFAGECIECEIIFTNTASVEKETCNPTCHHTLDSGWLLSSCKKEKD